jgi:hypothetical protein
MSQNGHLGIKLIKTRHNLQERSIYCGGTNHERHEVVKIGKRVGAADALGKSASRLLQQSMDWKDPPTSDYLIIADIR